MGVKALLLLPNTSVPYTSGTVIASGVLTSSTGSTIILDTEAAGEWDNVLPLLGGEFNSIRTDWIKVTHSAVDYIWRIKAFNISSKTITIDGSVPANCAGDAYVIYSAVDARCAWSTVTTVTYFECEFQSWNKNLDNEVKITRGANRISVIVNLKKFKGTGAFSNMFCGNLEDSPSIAGQLKKFWEYAHLYWPSISPKYSILYWYNWPTGTENTKEYQYRSATYSAMRVVPRAPKMSTDLVNNVTFDQFAVEIL